MQRLEIHGFKSFVDRTDIQFGTGITGIVGPNGCGKTNLTDAIRWVLGEQSAKQLRGDSMEDVIFGGSVKRKPIGMAEVTLTLLNDRGALPTEYTEVQIGRRVYRNGSSEYFLNKTAVRLRDIRDLFYGTGMGSHAYSVIERSMVDHVLSDASGHRRFLFEEASGITKYKQRKREALNKLDATEGDLLRVQDIIVELDRELGSLARQVAKTRRAQRLREGIRDLDLRLSYEKNQSGLAQAKMLGEQRQEEAVRREAASTELAKREAELVTHKTALLDEERALTAAREALAEAEAERARAEHEAAVLGERSEGLERRIADLAQDHARLEARLAELGRREEDLKAQVATLSAASAQGATDTAARERGITAIEDDLKQRREEAARGQAAALELMQAEAEQRAELEAARARLAGLAERHGALAAQVQAVGERVASLEAEDQAARADLARVAAESEQVRAAIAAARSGLEACEASLATAGAEEAEHREALTAARVRIEALEDLKSAMEGLEEGVKKILSESKSVGVRGVVSESLIVDPAYLDAVEALLGSLLGAAVVDSETQAKRALALVGGPSAGHAYVTVLERGRGKHTMRAVDPREHGIVGWVREGVKAGEAAEGLVEVLLADAVLVETPEDAEMLSAKYPELRFVSRSGVVWAGGLASGGRPTDADRGLLRRETELRELRVERERLEAVFASAGEEKLRLVRARDDAAKRLGQAEKRDASLRHEALELETRREGLEREMSALREEKVAREREASEFAAQTDTVRAAATALETELARHNERSASAGEQVSVMEATLVGLERKRDEEVAALAAARQAWIETTARYSTATADLARAEAERAEIQQAIEMRAREREQAEERRAEAGAGRTEILAALEMRRGREAELRATAEQALERARGSREHLEAEESAIGELRHDQLALSELVHNLEVQQLTVRGELERTFERLRVEYDVDLERFTPEPLPEGETWNPEDAERLLEDRRERYRSLGPVNLLALEEFNKKKERHTFLTTQRDDLLQAKAQLLEAIEKINTTASQLFVETFADVEKNFRETFSTLFQGGECALRMVGDDPLECEIEIAARPRGKNLQSISLLSGGERALTAIALLFAIYLVKPSPFCILDEVDAPLDDANVDRFVNMLRRFSDRTQFIVVTHNKKTMEIAESLYGVTMQEPGVSKLVSVRFNAAAERNGDHGKQAEPAAQAPIQAPAEPAQAEEPAPEPSLAGVGSEGDPS
ncbi:MAG TPA: chromosome segregation protein SMC [Candidatus Eisenbacteria bacterium]|nr:chromosome segregation protein SMC [Candidatus Eisenbacteria bacterium]